jgi:general secretion pathway protein G
MDYLMRPAIYILLIICLVVAWGVLGPRLGSGRPSLHKGRVTEIATITTALNSFMVDVGHYPAQLKELLEKPPQAANWHGPYLQEIPGSLKDSWHNSFNYECPGKHNTKSFDLYSAGPDGRVGTDDDITNWQVGK